jgi:hypothetical protein
MHGVRERAQLRLRALVAFALVACEATIIQAVPDSSQLRQKEYVMLSEDPELLAPRDGGSLSQAHYASVADDLLLPLPCREYLPDLFVLRNLTGVGAEIGVQRGGFSQRILSRWPGKRLFLIDLWAQQEEGAYVDIANVENDQQELNYRLTLQRVMPFRNRTEIVLIRDYSTNAAARIQDHELDWAYLDGDHSYAGVVADINAYWPKVKPGGILAGHDYFANGHYRIGAFGVMQAVLEFAARERVQVMVTYGETRQDPCTTGLPSWYVLKPKHRQ